MTMNNLLTEPNISVYKNYNYNKIMKRGGLVFWKVYLKFLFKSFTGHSLRNFGKRKINPLVFYDVLEENIYYERKSFDFYSYTYPELKHLKCYLGLVRTVNLEDIANKYIGFLNVSDSAYTYKKKSPERGMEYWIEVKLHYCPLKEIILDYYVQNRKDPFAIYDLQHDMQLLQDYMNYSADRVIDNISKNTLSY